MARKSKDKATEPALTPEERARAAIEGTGQAPQIVLAEHPHARRSISRFKAWGGLIGFVFVAAVAGQTDMPAFDVWWRALAGGIGGWLAGWALGLAIWRPVARAEAQANAEDVAARYKEALAQYEQRVETLRAQMAEAEAAKERSDAAAESSARSEAEARPPA